MKKISIKLFVLCLLTSGLIGGCSDLGKEESLDKVVEQDEQNSTEKAETVIEANIVNRAADKNTVLNSSQIFISADEAKKLAFHRADVFAEEVESHRVTYEMDRGISQYRIEFLTKNKQFEYMVDAIDGKILDENEKERAKQQELAMITEDEVKKIALHHVGVTNELNVRIKLVQTDKLPKYEGEFILADLRYSFLVNAVSGEILEWKSVSLEEIE